MARYHGRQSAFFINDGSWRNLGSVTTSVEISSPADTVEVSGMGDTTKSYVVGLKDSVIRAQFVWEDSTNGVHDTLNDQVGSSVGMRFYPRGSGASNASYTGSVIVSEYSVSSGIGGAVSANVSFVADSGSIPVWGSGP